MPGLIKRIDRLTRFRLCCRPPVAPSGVAAATGGGSMEVQVTWDPLAASASVGHYRVYRRKSAGQFYLLAALIGTIFAQTTAEAVNACYRHVTDSLEASGFTEIAAMLDKAQADLTAFATMPTEHWRKIWSNNPIERLNREIKRRADVVQIFPDRGSVVTRLIGAILLEQHEEWHYGERRYLSETSMRRLIDTLHEHTHNTPNPLPLTA